MAPTKGRLKSSAEEKVEKTYLKCCKTKSFACAVCIVCGEAFHKSCAVRDGPEKLKFIDETRVICCQDSEVSASNELKDVQIQLLRRILSEMEEKNSILQENVELWKEKYNSIVSEHPNSRHSKDSSPRPLPASAEIHEVSDPQEVREEPVDASVNAPIRNIQILKPENNRDGQNIDITNNEESTSNLPPNGDSVITAKNNDDDAREDSKWTTVVNRKNKYKSMDLPKPRRPEPLKGTNNNTTALKAAQRMSFLFLSGLSPEITSEAVVEYLKENNLHGNVTCERMKTKKERYRSSFRLVVPYSVVEKYFDADLWPTGITINHFQNLQRQSQNRQRASTVHQTVPERR